MSLSLVQSRALVAWQAIGQMHLDSDSGSGAGGSGEASDEPHVP
jgi:hypothetical protein